MKFKHIVIFLFACLNLCLAMSAGAQEHQDDCNISEEENRSRSAKQAISDSMDLVHYIPAVAPATEKCVTPSGIIEDVIFKTRQDKLFGFYEGIKNADCYLVIISPAAAPVDKPVQGIRYKAGDYIGKGAVISANVATAFIATGLNPQVRYRIDIYAANTNCASGIIYTTEPVYSVEKGTTGTTVYNYYYGNLHSHSSYSDGNKDNTSLTPADDYAFAKDAACMDFLGIAEHNHFSSPGNPGMHRSDYHLGLQQATTFTANNPGFLALYGMEYGVISNGGHVIVYGIDSLLGWETISGGPNYDIFVGKYDYNGLYNVINRFKPAAAFGYFAHPDDSDYSDILNATYRPVADSAIIGSALENGPAFSDEVNYSDYPSAMSYLQYYKGLLAKGYHIGPTIDHDNHNLTFGRTSRSRLVILSPSLDKADFMQAMRSRHFYATHSCSAILDFMISGAEMGSEVKLAHEPVIAVSITDPASAQQPSIRIYKGTNDGNIASIVATGNGNTFTYTDNTLADGTTAYYFADIRIGNLRTLSSPIWYTRNDQGGTAVKDIPVKEPSTGIVVQGNPVSNDILHYEITNLGGIHEGTIEIVDVFGKIVYREHVSITPKAKSILLSGLPAGTYVIRLIDGNSRSYARFVKY